MVGRGHAGTGKAGDSAYGDGSFVEHWVWLATLKAASLSTAVTAHAPEPAAAPAAPVVSDGGGIPADQRKELQAILASWKRCANCSVLDPRPRRIGGLQSRNVSLYGPAVRSGRSAVW